MNITNKYCLLSELTQTQIDKLVELMPVSSYFHFYRGETVIGFAEQGTAGTWYGCKNPTVIITYKEMLSLLGAKEEEKLVPHVHQKEIIAWANGEEIEVLIDGLAPATWAATSPSWRTDSSYRVKSKPTPTQIRIKEVVAELLSLHKQDAVERGIESVLGEVDES
jgi:hypothetical protein